MSLQDLSEPDVNSLSSTEEPAAKPEKEECYDCDVCDAPNSVKLNSDYEYHHEESGLTLSLPVMECGECEERIFTDESFTVLLNAIEKHEGRHYTRVKVIDGKIIKYSIH